MPNEEFDKYQKRKSFWLEIGRSTPLTLGVVAVILAALKVNFIFLLIFWTALTLSGRLFFFFLARREDNKWTERTLRERKSFEPPIVCIPHFDISGLFGGDDTPETNKKKKPSVN